ncbi:MAG: hypothetical protein AAGA72_00430 [Pseudomonadota bacterium]
MRHLSTALATLPYYAHTDVVSPLKRKTNFRPPTSGKFVLPIRQSLVMDARMSPGTTRMIVLLAGWSGGGRPVETTLGIIGKHLGRSSRQVQRYLRDAAEEGYLYFRKVVNRLGYVVGLRIVLCKAAIFAPKRTKAPSQTSSNLAERRRIPATTDTSDTNKNIFINRASEEPFDRKLREICERNGIPISSG